MKNIKTLAMYLPQFHRLEENDKWWGKGFTEWTAVKAAEVLFEGHNQVREPLDDNYYDLMQKEVMEWQADLAMKYNISGFCFYHYYFKDGRKILEKPAENLLQWKDINMPFCFCWANGTWARTWSNIGYVNSWSEKFENKGDCESSILLEQNYGGYEQWKAHLEYLLPFFDDERYIKIENKPVFLFFKPDDIPVLSKMLSCWRELLNLKGYEGIYAIGINVPKKMECLDATLIQMPNAVRQGRGIAGMYAKEKWINGLKTYNYEELCDNIVAAQKLDDFKTFFGGFVDFDDTPRRGKLGTVMTNVTTTNFERQMYQLAVKNIVSKNEYLFINAWNEWGEGNYLEPDKKIEYSYLEIIKRIMDKCNAEDFDAEKEWAVIKGKYRYLNMDNGKKELAEELNKFKSLFGTLNKWLTLKEQGKTLEEYFIQHKYKRVVIYGFAALGKHLYEELVNTSIEIVCAIDRRAGLEYRGLPIITTGSEIPCCDIVVVTPVYDFENISMLLKEKTHVPIVSLDELFIK